MDLMTLIASYWVKAVPIPSYLPQVTSAVDTILKNYKRYETVETETTVPAFIVSVFHFRETSLNFNEHLANGDPLFSQSGIPLRTVHVPVGLGPFVSWEQAAVGALKHQGFTHGYHWDIANSLDNIERYNGLGYRNRGAISPYVYAGTNIYKSGLYRADGVYDPNKIDPRPGCLLLLKELQNRGVNINDTLTLPRGGELT
jgi:lysozyme family protein